MDHTSEIQALLKSEDGVRGALIGKDVYDPILFAQDPRLVRFTAKQYLFLRAYRLGVPLKEAAEKADLTPEQADRFLDKPDTKAWLEDRALKDYIKNEWEEPGKWFKYGDEVLEGSRQASKNQIEVWKAFGERVAPKKSAEHREPTKIQINIDPTAVQEAFRRQTAIEAEVIRAEMPREAA